MKVYRKNCRLEGQVVEFSLLVIYDGSIKKSYLYWNYRTCDRLQKSPYNSENSIHNKTWLQNIAEIAPLILRDGSAPAVYCTAREMTRSIVVFGAQKGQGVYGERTEGSNGISWNGAT